MVCEFLREVCVSRRVVRRGAVHPAARCGATFTRSSAASQESTRGRAPARGSPARPMRPPLAVLVALAAVAALAAAPAVAQDVTCADAALRCPDLQMRAPYDLYATRTPGG